jgi:triosephosphate isomerase
MIIANWKSNIVDIDQWTHDFHDEYIVNERLQSTIFGVAPPSIYIEKIRWMKQIHHVFDDGELGFQEVFCGVQDVDHSYGSRTGAISVDMVLDSGCNFAIIGHSERRDLFNEDNDLIKKKLKSLKNKVMAVLCIGETKEENDKGITKDVLKQQLDIVKEVELDQSFTVAYEPVWAIGSGLTPEPKDINEIHKYIKDVVQSNSANKLIPEVLYGGSVTDKNAESFFKEEFVDGALVGGASLDGKTFARIVNIYNSTK